MDAGTLHRLTKVLRQVASEATSDPGEGPSGAELLVGTDVFTHSPTTVSEITERTGVVQSQVSRIIADMRAMGILEAEPDPVDRRRTLLSVAAEARQAYGTERGRRDLREPLGEVATRHGHPLTTHETDEAMELLDRLAALLLR